MSIQAKLIGLLLLIGLAFGIHWHGVNQGKKLERADWQQKEIARQQSQNKLLLRHAEEVAQIQNDNNTKNRKVSQDHANQLNALRTAAVAERAAANAAGGLRVPKSICDGIAATAEAASNGGRDAALAGAVRLPREIEENLWAIAIDADEVTEQARACQSWIRTHGFYGEPDAPH